MAYSTGVDYREIIKYDETEQGPVPIRTTNLVSGMRLIVAELNMLLDFPKHSLFFGNDLGLDLGKYQFVDNKTSVFNLIKKDIVSLFNKYGRARLMSLSIVFNERTNAIEIEINASPYHASQNSFSIARNIEL